jgi:RND superfamily putative drug exporter
MASNSATGAVQTGLRRLGRFAVKFRWPLIGLWVVAAVAASAALPSLSSVSKSNSNQFLPSSSPSVQAARIATPFQGHNPPGTAIIVASRSSGSLTHTDLATIARAEQAARRMPGVSLVRDEGVSRDGRATQALVTVTAHASNTDAASKRVVDGIRASFARAGAPPGLSFHLTGQLAITVDASNTNAGSIRLFTLLFVIVLLFVVYRAALAPVITLIPAVISLLIAGPLVAETAKAGLSIASVAQQLLIVLMLGAGTDYGVFLSFRVREELARGLEPRAAVVAAMGPVGEAIGYSAITVIAALVTLLLSSFSIYRGLGPALAIGIAVLLVSSLTLTPALLAIFGRAAFWPTRPQAGHDRPGAWGRVAERVVRRPRLTLTAGLVLFAALSAGLVGYQTGSLTSNIAPSGSDSAAGKAVIAAHFPSATVGAARSGHHAGADPAGI